MTVFVVFKCSVERMILVTLDLIGCWDRSQIEFRSILLECHFKLVFILNIMKKDIFSNIYKIKKW